MAKYLLISWMVIVTITGLAQAQYQNQAGKQETLSCAIPDEANVDNYDYVEIWRANDEDETVLANAEIRLASRQDGADAVFHVTNDNNNKYIMAVDFVQMTITFTILNLVAADNSAYFCVFEDNSGSTNSISPPVRLTLQVEIQAALTLTNGLDSTATVHDESTKTSQVVEAHEVVFTCRAEDAIPAPTITWQLNGATISSSAALTISTQAPTDDGTDEDLQDTVSTLTYTPTVVGNAPNDNDTITCHISQKLGSFDEITRAATQQLDVLAVPLMCFFEYDGDSGLVGVSIDVVTGDTEVITAVITGAKDAADITFTAVPDPSGTAGVDVDNFAGDTHLTRTTREYMLTADANQQGDTLTMSATNNAMTLLGIGSVDCSITLNVVERPTASFGGDNPVMSGSFGPFTSPTNLATCSDIPILQGQDLVLTCEESANVNPAAIMYFYYGDGPTDTNGNGLTVGDVPLGPTAGSASPLVVTLEAANYNFNNDNGGVVTCCADNGVGNPRCASACLDFIVAPDSLTLYDAANDVAGIEYEANRGEDIVFNCIATNANPAAGIEWDLEGRGALSGTYVPNPPVLGANNLYDTNSVLESAVATPYTYTEGDCDQELTCATDHSASGSELSDSTILKVRVPPDSATLVLIQNDANPAALSGDPPTALTVDENVGTDTVCLLHGRNYDFVATTDEVDPGANFRWTTTASVTPDPLRLNPADSKDITCNLATSSDNYDLDGVDCADFNNQNLCVEAWNEANSDTPIVTCVASIVVKAEVKSSNMALSIDGETPDANDVYTLTDAVTYTVDCQVTGAKPLPNIDIDLGEEDFGGVVDIGIVGSSDGTDMTDPAGTTNGGPCNSADRTGRDTFTADYADHCGKILICSAINDANRLIDDANANNNPDPLLANAGVQQSTAYTVNITVGPTITSLSVATEMDATDDDGDAIVYEGNDYVFTCTVTADPEVDIVWTVAGDTITPTDTAATSGVRCDGVDDISTYTLTGVTFADHQCAEVTCTAGDPANGGPSATINLQVWKAEPTGIALGYREGTTGAFTALSDGDVLHLDAGTQYDFECIVYDINPISPLPAGEAEGTCDELSSVERDVVDIDFYFNGVFNDGESNDDELATHEGGAGNIFDLTDIYRDTIATEDCNVNLVCNAAYNVNGSPASVDSNTPSITVTILAQNSASIDSFVLNEDLGASNIDQDLAPTDENAILIEGEDYYFDCEVTADPNVGVTFTLYNSVDGVLDTQTFPNTEPCMAGSYTETYHLNLDDSNNNLVTYDNLQCGYLECTANGQTARITFQVWTIPQAVVLSFAPVAVVGTDLLVGPWTDVADSGTIELDVGTDYRFRCTAVGLHPHGTGEGNTGDNPANSVETCDPNSGETSVNRDIANLFFTIDTDNLGGTGFTGDGEIVDRQGDGRYTLHDSETYLPVVADVCPTTISCRLVIDPAGNPTDVSSATPSTTVNINNTIPTTVTSVTVDDALYTDVSGDVIFLEGEGYTFTCSVTSDPEVDIVWTVAGNTVSTDTADTNGFQCDANDGADTSTYMLTGVTFAAHQCAEVTCSAGGDNKTINLQVWRAPTSIQLSYAPASENRVVTDNTGWINVTDNERIQLDDAVIYDFRCTAEGLHPHGTGQGNNDAGGDNPANSVGTCNPDSGETSTNRDIANIFFTIDTATAVTDDGVAEYAIRQTDDAFSLYNLIDSYKHQVLDEHDCPTTISCRVVFDPAGDPVDNAGATPSTTVEITHAVAPTINSLTADNAIDVDGSGDVILLDGEDTTFTCDVMGDPSMVIGWSVTDQGGGDITGLLDIVHTTNAPELAADCSTGPYQSEYTIRGVTFAQLQCAKVTCTVGGETETINVQIWRKPDTLVMYYAPAATDLVIGTWNPLEDGQNIQLETDKAYDFRCIAGGLTPHGDGQGNNIAGDLVGSVGVCPGGETFNNLDIADIYFTIDTGLGVTHPDGGTDEVVVPDAGGLYDLIDVTVHTPAIGHDCPSLVSCRLVFNPAGNGPADNPAATPAVTAMVTRISETSAVTITPPDFADTSVRGGVTTANDPNVLSLFDGDTYTLECVPVGADPDSDIIWYLLDDCVGAGSLDTSAIPDNQIIRDSFEPHEGDADCDEQNTPMKVPGDYDIWTTFLADFEDHNDKCLVCVSNDTRADQTSYEFAEYELDIIRPPSEIRGADGPNDDDGDGETGENDVLDEPLPICNGEAFDIMLIAYGASYVVDQLQITLDEQDVASVAGITVNNLWTTAPNPPWSGGTRASDINPDLLDSTALVTFSAGTLNLADNGEILEVCDLESNVCSAFELDVVDSPNNIELLVSDPFAANRDPPLDNPHQLVTSQLLRFHLNTAYLLTCSAEDARPAAVISYNLNPPNDPLNPLTTVYDPADPDSELHPTDQLFDSTGSLMFREDDFDSTGSTLCCAAVNRATEIGCNPSPVEHCVELEIIDEPSDLTMSIQDASAGGSYDDVGETYTELKQGEEFNFRCTSYESAPAADIKWYFDANNGGTYDLFSFASEPFVETVPSSGQDSLNGHYDTESTITFSATNELLGGTLRCCAEHIAIPGGDADNEGDLYEEDPTLELLCEETILRFPVPPTAIGIWGQLVAGASPSSFGICEVTDECTCQDIDDPCSCRDPVLVTENGVSQYQPNYVYVNLGDEETLNCTSYESRPYAYLAWSADETSGGDFVSSDCPFTYKESNPDNEDPLTMTYDTTKCVLLTPSEEDHKRKVYCTATNIADTVGISTCATLYVCVPCSENLKLVDVTPSGILLEQHDYDDGGTVVLRRNGQEHRVACVNTGARNRPAISVLLQLAGSDDEIELPSASLPDVSVELEEEDLGDGLWHAQKIVTLSLAGDVDLNGASLICRCVNDGCGESEGNEAELEVNLVAFDTPPRNEYTYFGTGNPNRGLIDIDGGRTGTAFFPEVILTSLFGYIGSELDPFAPPNFPPWRDLIEAIVRPYRNKRQVEGQCGVNQLTCHTLGTKPAVDIIWKLDDLVLSDKDFDINTYSVDSELNTGSQGLLDTYSTITLDPVYRGYHSRELCCEISSSDLGSPIRRCADLIVFSKPNTPLELSGTTVVSEGETVELRCRAEEHFPAGVFQWDDSDGNILPTDEAQTPTQLLQLPNYRLSQFSDYSFVASRQHNGKEITCTVEQDFENYECDYDATTTGQIEVSVNFCPTTNAELTGCPNAPISPGSSVTVSCQSDISNPAVRLDWYLNNVEQSQSGTNTQQSRDYGYVTIQTFTTRRLGLADDGLQLQCCPTHPTPGIGCGQLCTSVCTVRVEQPEPDVGCRWIRVEVTLEEIAGTAAVWHPDYANHQSGAYRDLTDGLLDVFRHIFDGLADYESAILPTLRESADGHVQVVVGLEFNAPYGTTTEDVKYTLTSATNANGLLVTDGGSVSSYEILPNSATAVCVCSNGYCVRGPDCRPHEDDFSSSCECPDDYAPPRCDVFIPPGTGTRPPPTGTGIQYGRVSFILKEIDDIPALWDDDYNDLSHPDTVQLINGLDTMLTGIFSPAFSNCFQNVRIADLFRTQEGGIGVVAGVQFTDRECGVSEDDLRQEFLESIDSDQKIAGSIYELDSDYLQETNVEEVCGNDFSCSNGGYCVPSDTVYYSSCQCSPGYSGSRCQDIIRIPVTDDPRPTEESGDSGLSTEALIGIIIGVVLFAAILLGLCLLCCFLCGGDRERVRTRYVYTDDDEPEPRRGFNTPPGDGSYPRRVKAYDDWPWSSDGRPPVAYNTGTFSRNFDLDFDKRPGTQMGPRPML